MFVCTILCFVIWQWDRKKICLDQSGAPKTKNSHFSPKGNILHDDFEFGIGSGYIEFNSTACATEKNGAIQYLLFLFTVGWTGPPS
jgi:hypothetical protein